MLLYDSSPIGDWNTITNKPFESFSEDDFVIDESNVVSVGTSIKNQLHTHDNKEVIDKFSVDTNGNLLFNGQDIKADGIDFTALSEMLVQGDNIIISTDEVAQTIKFSASGIDFESMSNALTTGTQSGITITADTENNRFNFEVTGIPTITIDSEGYWRIDGELGENPTKAQGNDGVSPTVDVSNTEIGVDINITDVSGTHSFSLTNGIDGETPHIDESSKHWFVGEIDTGIVAEGTTTIQTTSNNYTGTLTINDWAGDSAPYTQSVSVSGITSDISPIIDLIVSDDITTSDEEILQWSYITKATTGDNIITFRCNKTKPTIELNFKVKVV